LGFTILFLVGCSSLPQARIEESGVPARYALVPRFTKDSGIQPPKSIHRVDPSTPSGFIGSGRTAIASVDAVINAEGRVEAVWLVSGDPIWGQAVASAVRQWKFEPAKRNGEPIAVVFSVTSKFTSHGNR